MIVKLHVRLFLLAFIGAGTIGACSGDDAGSGPSDSATCATANNVVDGDEECDGTAPITATCATLTMNAKPAGAVKCGANCRFDLSGCMSGGGGAGGGGPGTGGAR